MFIDRVLKPLNRARTTTRGADVANSQSQRFTDENVRTKRAIKVYLHINSGVNWLDYIKGI